MFQLALFCIANGLNIFSFVKLMGQYFLKPSSDKQILFKVKYLRF